MGQLAAVCCVALALLRWRAPPGEATLTIECVKREWMAWIGKQGAVRCANGIDRPGKALYTHNSPQYVFIGGGNIRIFFQIAVDRYDFQFDRRTNSWKNIFIQKKRALWFFIHAILLFGSFYLFSFECTNHFFNNNSFQKLHCFYGQQQGAPDSDSHIEFIWRCYIMLFGPSSMPYSVNLLKHWFGQHRRMWEAVNMYSTISCKNKLDQRATGSHSMHTTHFGLTPFLLSLSISIHERWSTATFISVGQRSIGLVYDSRTMRFPLLLATPHITLPI